MTISSGKTNIEEVIEIILLQLYRLQLIMKKRFVFSINEGKVNPSVLHIYLQ